MMFHSTQKQTYAEASLDYNSPCHEDFAAAVRAAVKDLNSKNVSIPTVQHWSDDLYAITLLPFIERYGTHVIVEADLGGTAEMDHEVETCSMYDATTMSFGVEVEGVKLGKFFEASISGETEDTTSTTNTESYSSTQIKVTGGNSALYDRYGWEAWTDTLFDKDYEPAMVSFRVVGIWEVVTDRRLTELLYRSVLKYLDDGLAEFQDEHGAVECLGLNLGDSCDSTDSVLNGARSAVPSLKKGVTVLVLMILGLAYSIA
jgi:hypothetical protein